MYLKRLQKRSFKKASSKSIHISRFITKTACRSSAGCSSLWWPPNEHTLLLDDEPSNETIYLTVAFPRLSLKHDLYYPVDYDARSIEMIFSEPINANSVEGNLSFSDQSGVLNSAYDINVFRESGNDNVSSGF